MPSPQLKNKRIVLIHWKKQQETEVFSNLKNFCISYPDYNYNTLNNYLSKEKIPYDNEQIRVERKEIISKPKSAMQTQRTIVPVVRKVKMKEAGDEIRDLKYWLSQPVAKRGEAVTFLISQMLKKGERMDKTKLTKIRIAK
ncbi:hypothetical protein [Flavihumibacter sp. UBA7668]|uniref:hypothetical protein n=1 Tax=Flavihumibacter sp. UBA7668 TaxID=1946542 RepID=UPI0025C4DFC2|nr:hypothetical protein [Flavihumibacter sp. UBA7668]